MWPLLGFLLEISWTKFILDVPSLPLVMVFAWQGMVDGTPSKNSLNTMGLLLDLAAGATLIL
eukprot:1510929-Karenia_brevis.AAC.1